MKRIGVICLLLAFLLPLASALVDVQKSDEIPVVIAGSDDPVARYMLTLTNHGPTDDFQIYSLVGVALTPEKIHLESGKSTSIVLEARPNKHLLSNTRGFIKFQYELYSSLNQVTRAELVFRLVDMKDVFFFRPASVQPGDAVVKIGVQNLENARFDDMEFTFDSDLVSATNTLSIGPHETVNLTLPVDSEAMKKLKAGTYPLTVTTSYQGAEGTQETDLKYLERGSVSVAEVRKGVIIRSITTEKTNEGNVPVSVTISQRRDILTRLLTTQSPRPNTVDKRGFFVVYTWQQELQPAQTLHVVSTTNYTLPLIVALVIVLLVILVKVYTTGAVSLTKRVHFVRTKGGEFALKVTVTAHARRAVNELTITDRIPHAMKLYDSFGHRPEILDEATRRIGWKLTRLNAGESRVFSYIMYSKIRVVGSFELPLAHATYTHNGQSKSTLSNKTSFVAEFGHTKD